MSKLTVEGVGTFDVATGKRLVLALIDEAGVDQLHACGGNSKCTTCRVEFVEGEPEMMTEAPQSSFLARLPQIRRDRWCTWNSHHRREVDPPLLRRSMPEPIVCLLQHQMSQHLLPSTCSFCSLPFMFLILYHR